MKILVGFNTISILGDASAAKPPRVVVTAQFYDANENNEDPRPIPPEYETALQPHIDSHGSIGDMKAAEASLREVARTQNSVLIVRNTMTTI